MSKAKQNGKPTPDTITAVSVQGFKSIDKELELQIRPLTILAGVNSSGKSSIMQPLLLLKQTLESPSDPGPLLLNGPNVKFTQVDQMAHRSQRSKEAKKFTFGIQTNRGWCKTSFSKRGGSPLLLERMGIEFQPDVAFHWITPGERPLSQSPFLNEAMLKPFFRNIHPDKPIRVARRSCFLEVSTPLVDGDDLWAPIPPFLVAVEFTKRDITKVIHLPGHRGNPQRSYPRLAAGVSFPGTFDDYTASIVLDAQESGEARFTRQLGEDLFELRLTNAVTARAAEDTQIELQVARTMTRKRGEEDLVSIADVGFGVSQTLPVVVALLTAIPGQLVYIEQPEIHLHPRAQHAMAGLLVRAANRGVRVVAETHSSILLLGIQQHVAEGNLDPKTAVLHWFERNEDGNSVVTSREFDEAGAFGDWPADFDTVSLEAQRDYLDAATKKLLKR